MAMQEGRKGGYTNNLSPQVQKEMADARSQIIQKFQQPMPGPKIALKPKIKTNDPQGAPMTSFSKKLRKPSTYKPNSIDRTHLLKHATTPQQKAAPNLTPAVINVQK